MIGWEYPPFNSGGLGVACQGMTQALAANSKQIYFTLPYANLSEINHMQLIGCYDKKWDESDPFFAPFNPYSNFSLNTDNIPLDAEELRNLPSSSLEQKVTEYSDQVLKASNKNNDFAIVHAHDWMSFPAAEKIKKQHNRPVVAHVHSTEYDRIPTGHGSHFIMQTEKDGLEMADKVVAVSNYTKQILIQKYNINPDKIDVVYNGIDPIDSSDIKVNFAGDRPVIVFMGRLTMQKGAEYFLSLANQVLSKLTDALFVIAGNGDQYHSLILKNAQMHLSANLLFAGFVRGKQKDILLDRANVFVMPSLSEPFGLVALEAAQRNTPVIISKNSGVAEVMPSAKALDFWDTDLMSKEIVKLINYPQYAQITINNQKKDVAQVTWQNSAQQLMKVYRSVFEGN